MFKKLDGRVIQNGLKGLLWTFCKKYGYLQVIKINKNKLNLDFFM